MRCNLVQTQKLAVCQVKMVFCKNTRLCDSCSPDIKMTHVLVLLELNQVSRVEKNSVDPIKFVVILFFCFFFKAPGLALLLDFI